MADLVAIAKIVAPFGIKGYCKVQLFTHSPKRLVNLKKAALGRSSSDTRDVVIDDVLFQLKGCLIKFDVTPDRTAVERIVGNYLFVPEQTRAKPPRGEYFVDEVIGCQVHTAGGAVIGPVLDVLKYPAQDVWLIEYRGASVMIPAVKEFIKRVDVKNRLIIVDAIEGFLEG